MRRLENHHLSTSALDGFFHHVGIVLDVDGTPMTLESLPPRGPDH